MQTEARKIQPIFVGKREAAFALSVCVRTVENLIAANELPARKIGRRTVIPYASLIAFGRRDHSTRNARGAKS